MKNSKRCGERYIDVLTRKREEENLKHQLIIRECEKAAVDTTIALAIIALNDIEHMGAKRQRRFLDRLQELSNDAMRIQHEDGREVTLSKLETRVKSIMGDDFSIQNILSYDEKYLYSE